MAKQQSMNLHVILSTRELNDPTVLVSWFERNKFTDKYLIAVEFGTTGHPHLDVFCQMKKEFRTDKFKESICNLYGITDTIERKNVKCVINYIDDNPMYGYGYSVKENPKEFYTNLEPQYIEDCRQYYLDHQEIVNDAKEQLKDRKDQGRMTVSTVADMYLSYCRKRGLKTMFSIVKHPGSMFSTTNSIDIFGDFHTAMDGVIPFDLYQRINQEKLTKWVDECLKKKG